MRISDWSSDVCSSDLEVVDTPHPQQRQQVVQPAGAPVHGNDAEDGDDGRDHQREAEESQQQAAAGKAPPRERAGNRNSERNGRSEEHTSELQSLMRISYAVFCLKKKHRRTTITNRR